jgi:hypothetical protein
MKRTKIKVIPYQDDLLRQRIAFHEAGHTAGIHLNNKARKLPPVIFNIVFKEIFREIGGCSFQSIHRDCLARVEGGRLFEPLPHFIHNVVHEFTAHNEPMEPFSDVYKTIFEADIINLLIGPLAEAKYVANIDNELFARQLFNLNALNFYGGESDIAKVNEYFQSCSADKKQKDDKLNALFNEAFDFVNNDAHWQAITQLVKHMLDSTAEIMGYEEIVSKLDHAMANFKDRRALERRHDNGPLKFL